MAENEEWEKKERYLIWQRESDDNFSSASFHLLELGVIHSEPALEAYIYVIVA